MSEIYYKPMKALCEGGITRTARVKAYRFNGSLACDTWFACPAYVSANGKTVRGYVTATEEGLEFRAYLYRRNHTAITKVKGA